VPASADQATGACGAVPAGRSPILVLGVGNELFTDEGLGCVAAARIARLGLDVDVRDGSTLGVALLPEIADRQALLILDAIATDRARPGEVVELRDGQLPSAGQLTMSAHQIGVAAALAAAVLAGRAPQRLAAVGMVPVCLSTGYGLSEAVAANMPEMIRTALAVLSEWGVDRLGGLRGYFRSGSP
jgi:hydrogenase maturation protease